MTVVDDFRNDLATASQIGRCKMAFEHRKLQMIAKIAHRSKNFAKPLIVANVVADQEGVSHGDASLEGIRTYRESILLERVIVFQTEAVFQDFYEILHIVFTIVSQLICLVVQIENITIRMLPVVQTRNAVLRLG